MQRVQQEENVMPMRNREELLKIKEAFAYAMLDLLDVYDELLATGRVYVDEPTVNDLLKNDEESNA